MKQRTRMALLVGAAAVVAIVVAAAGAPKQAAKHGMMMAVPKQAQQLQKNIDSYKAQLAKQGKYACCIKPTCSFCAVHMGSCPCGMNAASDKPVCRECKGGWEAGEGAISGKKAADIKVMSMNMGSHGM